MSFSNHVYFKAIAHACFFEVLAENAIDQANRWEVLNAIEALVFKLLKVFFHNAEGVGAANACKHRGILNNRQHFCAHFDHNLVGITIGKQSCQRSATGHAETTRIVNYENICTTCFSGFSGDASASANTQQNVAFSE